MPRYCIPDGDEPRDEPHFAQNRSFGAFRAPQRGHAFAATLKATSTKDIYLAPFEVSGAAVPQLPPDQAGARSVPAKVPHPVPEIRTGVGQAYYNPQSVEPATMHVLIEVARGRAGRPGLGRRFP